MKVTIVFSEEQDDLGKGWATTFSSEGIEYVEDLLYAYGRAAVGAGFSLDGLEGRSDFYSPLTGECVSKKFNAEF